MARRRMEDNGGGRSLKEGRFPLWAEKKTGRGPAPALPACQKSLAEFAPAGANQVKSIFPGGMCVGENTSRPANVRAVRLWWTVSALPQAAACSKKRQSRFFDSLTGRGPAPALQRFMLGSVAGTNKNFPPGVSVRKPFLKNFVWYSKRT